MAQAEKTHEHGPHVHDSLRAGGKPDKELLLAGAKAWIAAIENGDAEIVSGTELAIDEDNDCIVFVRRIVKR